MKQKKSVIFGDDFQSSEQARVLKKKFLPDVEQFFRTPEMTRKIRDYLNGRVEIESLPEPQKTREWLFCSFVSMNGSARYAMREASVSAQQNTAVTVNVVPSSASQSANMQIVLKRFDEINQRLTAMCTRIEQIAEHLGMEESVPW